MTSKVSKSPVQQHYLLRCVRCHTVYSEKETVTSCLQCAGALDIEYPLAQKIKKTAALPEDTFSFLRQIGTLPLQNGHLVSLGEGNTPLIPAKNLGKHFGLSQLYLKYEGANPTGVFKDRGTALEITKALELGAKAVCCASTGNMAASVAAYAAKAGIPCYVLIPEKTPLGKLSQALAYGAHTLKIRGTYKDCVYLAAEMAKKYKFYLAGDYAFRLEGQKSVAYEVWRQSSQKVPDWVFSPIGCGTHLSAVYKGFCELNSAGLTEKIPHFLGIQPENMPTIVRSWEKRRKNFTPVKFTASVASAVAIEEPLDDMKVLKALYDSDGAALTVSEESILNAQRLLGTLESFFVEPSAALPVAALEQALLKKIIGADDHIVLFLTGTGLKDPLSIVSTSMDAPILDPHIRDLERYFALGLTGSKTHLQKSSREETLWHKIPSPEGISKEIQSLFDVHLSLNLAKELGKTLTLFQEKGKSIRFGDLKYAVENLLKMNTVSMKPLEVVDFSVSITQHRPPEAWVKVNFSGKTFAEKAKGVGPVDAIIRAIQKAIQFKDKTGAKLFDYAVEINTKGTDAVVEVRLGLRAKNGHEIIGEAISPDIIVASVRAFQNAYNILSSKLFSSHNEQKMYS